jgi:hypothetical protein
VPARTLPWARFAPSLARRLQSFAHPTVQHDRDAL